MQFFKKYTGFIVLAAIGCVLFFLGKSSKFADNLNGTASFKSKISACIPADRNNFSFEKVVLDLNAVFDPAFDRGWTVAQINLLAAGVKKSINNSAEPEEIMKRFNDYFFVNCGYVFDAKANAMIYEGAGDAGVTAEDFLNYQSIERVIRRRQGICLSLSMLYLIVAGRLNIPIYGVIVPGHIFVRYQDSRHSGINSETTFGGYEYYGYKGSSGAEFLDKTIYNKCLDNFTVIAAFLNNFSHLYYVEKQYSKALFLARKSTEMAPDYPESRNNLGIMYAQVGKLEDAGRELEESLRLFPDSTATQLNLGLVYLDEKRYIMAEDHLNRALNDKKTVIQARDAIARLIRRRGY